MLSNWLKRRGKNGSETQETEFDELLADHRSLLEASARSLELINGLDALASRASRTFQTNQNAILRELALLRERIESLTVDWNKYLLGREAAKNEELASIHTRLELISTDYLSRLQNLEGRWSEKHEFPLDRSQKLGAEICSDPADFALTDPEAGLMRYLSSYVPVRAAVDVGAHNGTISEHLLDAGYEVYAFEPYPPAFNQLLKRLDRRTIKGYNMAIGSSDSTMKLFIVEDRSTEGRYKDPTLLSTLVRHPTPEDLVFADSIDVTVRSLQSLAAEGAIPRELGLLKIDTEGYDLEVLKGLGDVTARILVCEYWAPDFIFGQGGALNRLDELVKAARARGYLWYVVLYRIAGSDRVSYYCNYDRCISNSWGNVVFFTDRALFLQAMQWCSAMLPATYFNKMALASLGPVPQSPEALGYFRGGPEVNGARAAAPDPGGEYPMLNKVNERFDELGKSIRLRGQEIVKLREEVEARDRSLINAVGRLEMRLAAPPQPATVSAVPVEETSSFKKQIEELRRVINEREAALEGLQGRLRRMKRSYSWRMTSPLRELRRAGARIGSYVTGRDVGASEK